MGTATGIAQAVGVHVGVGAQCTDAIETGIGADGPACILHMGMESGGLGLAKNGTGLPT